MALWGSNTANTSIPKWLTASEKALTNLEARGWVIYSNPNETAGELLVALSDPDLS